METRKETDIDSEKLIYYDFNWLLMIYSIFVLLKFTMTLGGFVIIVGKNSFIDSK